MHVSFHHFLITAVSICPPPPPPLVVVAASLLHLPFSFALSVAPSHPLLPPADPADLTLTLPQPVDTSSMPDCSWEPVRHSE